MRPFRLFAGRSHAISARVACRRHPQFSGKRFQSTVAAATQTKSEDFSHVKSFEEIPAIPSLPIIGSAWVYMPIVGKYDVKKLQEASMERYKQYGKIVREKTPFGQELVHLYDPADQETMFRFEGRTPNRIALEPLAAYRAMRKESFGGGGLVVMQGEDWRHFRMRVQAPLLRPRSIYCYIPHMDSVAQEMIEAIYHLKDANHEVPNFLNQLYRWALESVALVSMDTRLGCLKPNLPKDSEPQKMIDAVQYMFEALLPLSISLPIWKYFPTRRWRRLVQEMDFIKEISEKYIAEAMERVKSSPPSGNRELTVLQSLLKVSGFDKKEALSMVGDMLIGGIDTSSAATSFTLYHLSKNPEAQEKVYEEICRALPNKDSKVDQSVLEKIPYLKACFKEALRLNPVAAGTIRQLPCEVVFSGYRVPSGTLMLSQNGVTGMLEEYFDEPHKFKPERWLKEHKNTLHPFASLPFGFGPRMCIGRRLAEQEIWILLIKIFQNFRLGYADEELTITTRLINIPDKSLRFRFVPRS